MKWACGCQIDGQSIITCNDHKIKENNFNNLEYGLPEERELDENLKESFEEIFK